ncbi:MAG TPA: hypothetical protein VF698_17235 [Thermoanaerobaculia bacterium]|jgi:hypothetical protein
MEDIRSYRFDDDETVRILRSDDDTVRLHRRDFAADQRKDDVEVPFEIPRD